MEPTLLKTSLARSIMEPGEPGPELFSCWIPGEAKTFQRRGRVIHLPNGGIRHSNFMSPRSAEWKAWMRVCIEIAMEELGLAAPESGPVWLRMWFTLKKPKSKRKTDFYPTSKPDLTNLEKLAEDALLGLVLVDDSQVIMKQCGKRYHSSQPEGVHIYVGRMHSAYDGTGGHGFKGR